jgi:predicted O-methyltransferase YrrM
VTTVVRTAFRRYGSLATHVWLENSDRFRRRALGQSLERPYMRRREEEVLSELLTRLQPRRCLEWGSGVSTLVFPAHLPSEAKWTAIEHDPRWAAAIVARNTRRNVTVRFVPPDVSAWRGNAGDGSLEEFASYVAAPAASAPYDFVLVDGRARVACIKQAWSWLAPGGVVAVHDAGRPHYRAAFDGYRHQLLLLDHHVDSHGLWIGSHDGVLADLVSIEEHEWLWRKVRLVGRWAGI